MQVFLNPPNSKTAHFEAWFKKSGTDILSKLITWRGRRFTHVELAVIWTNTPVVNFEYPCFSADGFSGGTRLRYIKWEPNKWERVPIEFTADTPQYQAMVYRAVNLLNRPYDYRSLLEEFVNKTPSDKLAYNCSQYCTTVIQAAGILTFFDPETVSPGDLYIALAARHEVVTSLSGDKQ